MSKLARYAREIQLSQVLGANLSSKSRLAAATLLFHARTGMHRVPPIEEQPDSYWLNLLEMPGEIQLRRYAGDLFVLYEVFLNECYRIPPVLNLKPKTIVDLGANVGLATLYFARTYPQSQFVCIEPMPSNVRLLKANTAALAPRVRVIQGAVSSESGTVAFARSMWSWGGKLASQQSGEMVQTYTVAQVIDIFQLAQIDLLKVDIEGAERSLFLNGADWLHRVNAIIIELHDGFTGAEFERAIKPYGLTMIRQNSSYGNTMTMAVRETN